MTDPALEAFERLFGPEFGHGKPFDRAPLSAALHALGSPQANLPPVIHVAGTNGKGSTIAFMRAILEAAGLKVHAFVKPHLFRLNERFVIAGDYVGDHTLIGAAERVRALAADITQFDAQVAVAFLLFREAPADVVLLETGMGGRDDSTNVVSEPALAVITPIGVDHRDVLGGTLAEIAAHKAGILKPFVPAIIARQADAVREVIEAKAERMNAQLYRQGVEWDAYEDNGRLIVQTEDRALDLPLPALYGRHQVDNAGLACAALLAPWHYQITGEAFAAGVTNVRWPGRLQPLTRGPFSAQIRALGGEVWVDGGHNAHALAALAAWQASAQRGRPAPFVLIFGARARKDWAIALSHLAMASQRVIAVQIEDGVDPQSIVDQAKSEGAKSVYAAPSLQAAIQNAAQFPAPRVLICGSFLLAAEALAAEGG